MKAISLYFVLLAFLRGQTSAAGKPNILIIVSDDQGYADLGFCGSKQAVTPHLDALAKSSVRVTFLVSWPDKLLGISKRIVPLD